MMGPFPRWVFFITLSLVSAPLLSAQEPAPVPETSANFLFRDEFYLNPDEKLRHNATPIEGFLVVERSTPEWNSNIALVSGFAPQALRTRILKDVHTVEEARDWIKKQKKTTTFEGVTIHELDFTLPDGRTDEIFWVGNKSFETYDKAAAQIATIQSVIEIQGGNFERALEVSQQYAPPQERAATPEETAKADSQFKREEEIALRWADQLDLGEKIWGPFHGVPAGEPILYQSFGETTWRSTNLAERSFRSQVGFWTNRLVFKGLRFPLSTIDAYVEITAAPEATGNAGGSQLDTVAGLEWRPFIRNRWLENFRPWGIPLLAWAKNYRFVVEYYDRRNLKDEIANIRDFDFRFGVDIFYEFGIDLNPIDQKPAPGFAGFLSEYVWGEYFGDYTWRDTNFTSEENFDAWILDTSVILGVKVPIMKLPPNPINEELMLMPYFRFALTQNTRLSSRSDNRYFVAVGLRWMPFRDYRFANNEWLFKTKVFAEYLAIGKVQNLKQDDLRPEPDEDWRIGVAWSLRRF